MDPMTALGILVVALVAGVLGALLGLGGGIIVIPGLTLALGFGMQEAIGASLMGVIASSTGAAVRYVKQGYVNVRLGMLLETATTTGAIIGALVSVYLDQDLLAILFSIVLVYGAYHMLTRREKVYRPEELEAESQLLDLSCTYVDQKNGEEVCYGVKRYRTGLLASLGAGGLSGLLGVGGGVIKVPVMNACMCVPMKAATATSNFMIGVTALAGAIIYVRYGYLDPILAGLTAMGVLGGAVVGSRLTNVAEGGSIRTMFGVLLLAVAALMVLKGLGILEVV